MRTLPWIAAVALVAGGLMLFLSKVLARPAAVPVLEPGEAEREPAWSRPALPIEAAPATDPSAASEVPGARFEPERRSFSLPPIGGILCDAAGVPLAGAELTWTALTPELEALVYPRDLDPARLEATTVRAASDGAGRFVFPAIPPGALEHASVVWVTHPGREAAAVLLDVPRPDWSWTGTIDAPARPAARALVLSGTEAVAGARVRQTLSFWDAGQPEPEKRARRVFWREAETAAHGTVAFAPGAGTNALESWRGEERSLLWLGEPEGDVRLELLPGVRLSGIVLVEGALELTEARYRIGYFSAPDRSDLVWAAASLRVRADGGFGPDTWPRPERARLVALAFGGDLVPVEEVLVNPAAGQQVFLELETKVGLRLPVEVTSEGEPLAGASVQFVSWTGSTLTASMPETTSADGRVEVRGLPPGQLQVEVKKLGFTSRTIDDHRVFLPRHEEGPLRVVLDRAGVVEGSVVSDGEPVREFVLLAWTDDLSFAPYLELASDTGSFRVEDAPIGRVVHLTAYTPELPQSERVTVIPGEDARRVTLELPVPRRARGRVVDSQTGEPIPTATIQHLTAGLKGMAGARGSPMSVDHDGRFELDGFHPGRGGFHVVAAGYESLCFFTREDDVEVIDVGLLALNPLAILDLSVREDGVSDYSSYRAWNRQNDDQEPRAFSADGRLELPSRTGVFIVQVSRPDGTLACESGVALPGAVEPVEFDFTRGVELAVRLSTTPPGVERWVVRGACTSGEREERLEARWSAEREAFLLRGMTPGDAVLELRDPSGALLVQRSVRLTDEPFQAALIDPGSGRRQRIRLIDERGQPWSSGFVVVSLDDASGWSVTCEPDSGGELEVGPLCERAVVLSAKLGNEFIAYGIRVELDPSGTTSVTIPDGERSYLTLAEEGRPCAGVHVSYGHERAPRTVEFSYISDEAGLVRGPLCLRSVYRVRVHHAGYWPAAYSVEPRGTSAPVALELRSRGTLEFTVTDGAGRAIAGAELELVHVELAERARSWAADGAIRSTPEGLRSDDHGRLVLEGVPRGSYVWTWTAGEARASGNARLGARGRESVRVMLGD